MYDDRFQRMLIKRGSIVAVLAKKSFRLIYYAKIAYFAFNTSKQHASNDWLVEIKNGFQDIS